MFIIHGNIRTMEECDFPDGYLEIADGKIAAVGDMRDCPKTEGEVLDAQGSLVRKKEWRGMTVTRTWTR